MSDYVMVVVWLAGAGICLWIARARHVEPSFFWNAIVVLLGPLAIPLLFLAKRRPSSKDA